MRPHHTTCSLLGCPKCEKENIAFLAYSFHKKGVNVPTLKRMTLARRTDVHKGSVSDLHGSQCFNI